MREKYDVILSGGGFAGSLCGIFLARAGVSVLIVEAAERTAKDKACGGGMQPGTAEELANILGAKSMPAFRVPGKFRFCYHGDEFCCPNSIAVFQRKELDDALLNAAEKAGADVMDCAVLTAIDPENRRAEIRAKRAKKTHDVKFDRLIAADGATSWVRRRLTGRQQPAVLALAAFSPSPADDMIFDYFSAEDGGCGYAWSFPSPEGANLGVGIFIGEPGRKKLDGLLEDFIRRLGVPASPPRAAWIPARADILLSFGETLFIGDAA